MHNIVIKNSNNCKVCLPNICARLGTYLGLGPQEEEVPLLPCPPHREEENGHNNNTLHEYIIVM